MVRRRERELADLHEQGGLSEIAFRRQMALLEDNWSGCLPSARADTQRRHAVGLDLLNSLRHHSDMLKSFPSFLSEEIVAADSRASPLSGASESGSTEATGDIQREAVPALPAPAVHTATLVAVEVGRADAR